MRLKPSATEIIPNSPITERHPNSKRDDNCKLPRKNVLWDL